MRHDDPLRDLLRASRRLSGARRGVPTLYVFTDPQRTPDPLALAGTLPPGVVVVYRAFGAADARDIGQALRRLCDTRGLRLLVGADEALAVACRADGLHLPERMMDRLPRIRQRRRRWMITVAAHGLSPANRASRAGADVVFVSPAFPSRSPSAGRPLGPMRMARIARATGAPVAALGGVNGLTARRLQDSGVAGLAAVDAFRTGTRSPAGRAAADRAAS